MEPSVSVLMLACNKAAYTRRALRSLLQSSLRPFQVVLVDNGSSDETPRVLDDFRRDAQGERIAVEVITHKQNLGAIVGRNAGMERLTGEYWAFLDNDVAVRSRSWLERLRDVLAAEPGVGVAAPKLVYANPPHDIQCAGCAVTRGGRVIFSGRGEPRLAPAWNAPRDCQTLISACWLMPARVARVVGPLDERFSPVQFEDIDYCYRIREAGLRCRYVPDIEMYHFENVTTRRSGAVNYPYVTVKNGLKFKQKWHHRFAQEDGPPDEAWKWAAIPGVQLEDVPEELELLP